MLLVIAGQTDIIPQLALYDHLQHLLVVKMRRTHSLALHSLARSSIRSLLMDGPQKCRSMHLHLFRKATSGWETLETSLGFLPCLLSRERYPDECHLSQDYFDVWPNL